MNYSDPNNRDEFYWEEQFRKDETRIHSCMKEISAVIDLPGEDELLMKRIQKQPEYAKENQRWAENIFDDFFELDEVMFSENWRETDGATIYSKLEKTMEHWCQIFAEDSSAKHLEVLCHYGYLMGFAVDLVDFGEEKVNGLKIALCKRIFGRLNKIVVIINDKKNATQQEIEHKNRVLEIRQEVLNLRFRLKEA